MSLNDTLSNTLSKIRNAERIGRKECFVSPSSKIIKQVLKLMKDNHYVGDFKEEYNERGCLIKLNLIGKINRCGTIKPRFAVSKDDFEKFEKRYLLAKGFGMLIVSTNQGIMSHEVAKKKGIGGKLLAYIY